MKKYFQDFRNDEDGAVTVDFVVLTAAIVVLGLLVGAAINSGALGLANEVEDNLGTQGNNLAAQPIPGG